MKTKILVCSDTHGKYQAMVQEIQKFDDIKAVLHLGDHARDGKMIQILTRKNVYAVLGNNDRGDKAPEDQVIRFGDCTIYMVHGHQFSPRLRLEELTKKAASKEADIALFGHSHTFETGVRNGVVYLNPGAIFRPRGDGQASYALLTLSDDEDPIVERILLRD